MSNNSSSHPKSTDYSFVQNEEKQQSVGQFISKLFKFNKSPPKDANNIMDGSCGDQSLQETLPNWATDSTGGIAEGQNENIDQVYQVDPTDGRTHLNVLKRISNLLALKSNNLQDYSDTELKQYWMPDSVSKECYVCSEKFTTFRRRHHCRLCGQIFCSQCCNQQIPGKIFGCTGDLRVCKHCCKVVLTYLQSIDLDSDSTGDLRSLQESLMLKYGSPPTSLPSNSSTSIHTIDSLESGNVSRRKVSLGYQEEKFAPTRSSNVTYLTNEEKYKALQNSVSLRNLYEEIFKPTTGIPLQAHRYRLRTYNNCLLGSELVDWLIYQQKSNNRAQASAICQALLEGGYLECITESPIFVDGYMLYKPGVILSPELLESRESFESSNPEEPSWTRYVPHESSTTDSDTEFTLTNPARMSSSTSYTLDLNVGANTVYLSRPLASSSSLCSLDSEGDLEKHKMVCPETPEVRTSEQREFVPESGWHNASKLREENGEKTAYNLLAQAFAQHEDSLLKQLLSVNGLTLAWSDVLKPLIHDVVDSIRPDMTHNAQDIDIRQYVHFKKVLYGIRNESRFIKGIVFSKNIAHKSMSKKIDNPKILLLQCSIAYHRQEGRLISLEPVLMQELEYLRHVTTRIVTLQPDIVLVQRTVSRLAQDLLRENGVTLVFNVKEQILERLARCTQADLVSSIDTHIGPRPRLGTCKKFFLRKFTSDVGNSKTLMIFEGLPLSHLGGSVLLRGHSKKELMKVKKVASLLLFACYNWRLEKSFLMDEFAEPPNPKHEFFDESKENSPISDSHVDEGAVFNGMKNECNKSKDFGNNKDHIDSNENSEVDKIEMNAKVQQISNTRKETKGIECDKATKEDQILGDTKVIKLTVNDFTDPLHSNNHEVFTSKPSEKLSVAELPFSNHFRKALDDTILCISPYLVFSIPYLETEQGRKCKLRKFFPSEIYYSLHFDPNKKIKSIKDSDNYENAIKKCNVKKLKPPHPFITAQICKSADSAEVQSLLAHFRACGGRYEKKNSMVTEKSCENEDFKENDLDKIDVLNPNNHQKISVLFCSFSHESNNAPAFCVYPWVVPMAFYGDNDIPLGCFLERYCFRRTYQCQSKTCETPMLKHIRRFVHNMGCVSISLNSFENDFAEDNIVMWSWCSKCQSVSPIVPMSTDTWSFSFAKYLQLRFHAGIYSRRGTPPCKHSLHHDHHQYFGYKNIVASFQYTTIQLWEISLPPPVIEILYDPSKQQAEMIDEIKMMAQKGHEIYSLVNDKLAVLPNDFEFIGHFKQILSKEQLIFKQKIEEVQIKLTSPTIESREKNFSEYNNELQTAIWKIADSLVRIKKIIADAAESWNTRLSEVLRKKDNEKKKEKNSELESPSGIENKTITSEIYAENSNVCNDNIGALANKKIRSLDQSDNDENKLPPSPKCHQRSYSDGTVLSQNEDNLDSKKESDKKSVKNIFSQLLPTNSTFTPIPTPFSQLEHYLLPPGVYLPIIVYENEPSSIIAYALNSFDYKRLFDDIQGRKLQSNDQTPSPVIKRKSQNDKEKIDSIEVSEKSSLLSFLRTKDTKADLMNSSVASNSSDNGQSIETSSSTEKTDESKKLKQPHIEIQFDDSTCNFFCRIYYAERFAWLRSAVLPIGEEAYVRSISKSIQWNARGGKSGSTFCKTSDDRFVLKEMPSNEVKLFLDFAPNYFTYMQKCYTTGQPTLLGKIVGIYQIIFRNSSTNATLRSNILVMENLFYNRKVSQKFDLKGSMRNRLANTDIQDGEIVLLDENLLKMTCDSPLYILPHSKAVLTMAIQNDTDFLASQSVMDYSLLVGLDSENKELILGIIDYIRTFTWDKKIETIVKKSLGQGKLPTIISPNEYQTRFIQAMHRYFFEVPDPWAGLGKGLEY